MTLGLALLVRQSIEQGWSPPPVRLAAAALLSLALGSTAELFRRRGTFAAPDTAGLIRRAADVPSILLGTGLAGLFAVSYATYGVYGYVGPTLAFLAMAAAALGGIAASFTYGPALGILGYLGAESVPLLTAGSNEVAGATYAALVGVTGYAAAYRGRWRRLENPAGAILLLWAGLLQDGALLPLALVSVPAGMLALGITALRLRPHAAWASRRPSVATSVALGLVAGHGLLLATHVASTSNLLLFQPMAPVLGLLLLLVGFGFAATATRGRAMAPVLAAAIVGALAAMDPALLADRWQHRLVIVGLAPFHLALALGVV